MEEDAPLLAPGSPAGCEQIQQGKFKNKNLGVNIKHCQQKSENVRRVNVRILYHAIFNHQTILTH